MKLEGKTILITGGTSGIGLELARRLVEKNNTVIVTGRNIERLKAVEKALKVRAFQSDVKDLASIRRLHEDVLREFPQLSVLVNNAGVMRSIDLKQTWELEDLTEELQTNLMAPMHLVQVFLSHLRKQPEGLIVNVSSGLAFMPLPVSPIYCAAKAGMHSYTLSLRAQLRGTSIKVVELAPPGVETPLYRGVFEKELKSPKGMDVAVLVNHAIYGIEKGRTEIRPGIANILKIMSRLAPNFMFNQMAKMLPKNTTP